MGIVKLPEKRVCYREIILYNDTIISNATSKKTYDMVKCALDFTHDGVGSINNNYDPRKKLGNLLDETIVGYRSRNFMKYYIHSKLTKWGFKMYILSESKTGHCAKIFLDPGKNHGNLILNKDTNNTSNLYDNVDLYMLTKQIIKNLIFYFESWYTSPDLFILLRKNGIAATGMARESSSWMPRTIC